MSKLRTILRFEAALRLRRGDAARHAMVLLVAATMAGDAGAGCTRGCTRWCTPHRSIAHARLDPRHLLIDVKPGDDVADVSAAASVAPRTLSARP